MNTRGWRAVVVGFVLAILLLSASATHAGNWLFSSRDLSEPKHPGGIHSLGWNNSKNCLYGCVDHHYGRGPLVDLGAASMSPDFHGYDPINSPGYGLGTRPTTRIDLGGLQRVRQRWRMGIYGH